MKFKLLTTATLLLLLPNTYADVYNDTIDESADFFDDFYGSEQMVEIATGIKTQIYKAPAVATVFTAEQIKNMGATDIDDVLETVPGLHISRNAIGYNPIYSFRGIYSSNNGQALMMINGTPITNSFTGNRNQVWGGMPVEAIARIEVMRGPGSAIYGADAFAGVINIITKNADDIADNQVAYRAGTFDTHDVWLTLAGHSGNFKYASIFEYHKTDGSDKIITADRQTLNDIAHGTSVSNAPGQVSRYTENYDYRGELNYHDLTIRAGIQKRLRGIGIGLAEALDPSSRQSSTRWNFDISYDKQLTPNFEYQIKASYFDTTQEVEKDYIIYPSGYANSYPDGLIGNPEVFERHKRLNFNALYSGWSTHKIRFGMGYHNADLYKTKETKNFSFGANGENIPPGSPLQDVSDTDYIFLKERARDNTYLFIQDVWNFTNDWELTTGIRYDQYSDFGSTTNPRLALVWSTSLNLSTKLLYGKAFRAPSFSELGNINNPSQLGNPNLNPETIETTELVFDYHPANSMSAIVSFYQYNWDEIIILIPDNDEENILTSQNYGKQSAQGAELELNWKYNDILNISINYAYSDAKNDLTNQKVLYVPAHQWFIQTELNLSESLHLNIRNNIIQDRQRALSDSRKDIDDYLLTDLALRWSPVNIPIELALISKNIFNVDAREPSLNRKEVVYLPNDLPLPGRTLFGEIRYRF
ncbi:TonB-dependent receptor [Catenovulum sp. 2E275]|uniref:TonB-dependent receptor plug domain-containing protein n=1 Tax=Catenovulum sp. 2E275 TaxID=2980497 RepID=UPI0021D360B3|nr:TonB-dependent receptor [Catenovulum sp. 2E275]MCU4675144.1 TonB-dependent receptor [Catenovulum sp. 2E275]